VLKVATNILKDLVVLREGSAEEVTQEVVVSLYLLEVYLIARKEDRGHPLTNGGEHLDRVILREDTIAVPEAIVALHPLQADPGTHM